ncbi:hypothetical protein GGS23DRAFT_605297 [Durotheca rogersii]|uniref:uncharacterized protein n=1 Tax=Durotheca rogersii TaxID=419775 RepID=UPI00221FC77A|nr:uncharacterized protein GGS23DRAFT_605297 [Durotheca rogersii]KAI5863285.1 hypothetical protein GGS23DRAFT_605297 [Durotheca rogersii]
MAFSPPANPHLQASSLPQQLLTFSTHRSRLLYRRFIRHQCVDGAVAGPTTVKRLFDEIDRAIGDVLIVYGVSVQQFAEIDNEREQHGRRFRLRRFEASGEILIITIPTRLQEALHLGIWRKTDREILQMGLENSWISTGSATNRALSHPNGDSGEGDSTGGPSPQQGSRRDMRWWFRTSNHQVKIILLAGFDRGSRNIILEKRVETPARLKPTCSQVITITQDPDISEADRFNPSSYSATNGASRLEFGLLFLRQPGQGESDVVINIQDLR